MTATASLDKRFYDRTMAVHVHQKSLYIFFLVLCKTTVTKLSEERKTTTAKFLIFLSLCPRFSLICDSFDSNRQYK